MTVGKIESLPGPAIDGLRFRRTGQCLLIRYQDDRPPIPGRHRRLQRFRQPQKRIIAVDSVDDDDALRAVVGDRRGEGLAISVRQTMRLLPDNQPDIALLLQPQQRLGSF